MCSKTSISPPPLLHAQVLRKFGAVNIPVWYEAGKYAQDSSPIPFSEGPCTAPSTEAL